MWGRIISTHALTEGDCHPPERRTLLMKFQLTPSRRATINLPPLALRSLISTHALTEGDSSLHLLSRLLVISTHALTEGDEVRQLLNILSGIFQLTPSRRATSPVHPLRASEVNFNSRPHGGRRLIGRIPETPERNFNSRPHGGRPCPPTALPATN